jgi:hypothetical protein
VNSASAQPQPPALLPAPESQSAIPAIPAEPNGPSLVFPEGGFPSISVTGEGDIPDIAVDLPLNDEHPELHASGSDYGPSGYDADGFQDATGAWAYQSLSDPLPDYYYRPGYYDQPGIGARPLADYAPAGYEAREFEDGAAAPEFTPITPPVPVTPEERAKFVTRGLFPGSYLVPGTNTSFRFRGFVRLAGLYDFDPIGSRDDFVTNTIPIPQQSGQNFNYAARYSRIGLDTWTPSPIHEWNIHTFIEGDFFNGPAQAVGGGGNPFRLRFAFIDFGYFRFGQQNTVFMDSNAWPVTVDFAGPRGLLNQRRPGARITVPLADKLYWAAGVEQPFSDITTNGLGAGVQDVPDFATHLRYEADLGHLQFSGIGRAIGFRPTGGEVTRRGAWGLSASGVVHPWAALIGSNPVRKSNPTGLERSRMLAQYNFGYGIGRYVQDTAGLGLDAQVDPITGAIDTPYTVGWSTSYEHWFNEHWLSNVTYSEAFVQSFTGQPGSTYDGARYLAVSLWWRPITNMAIAVEVLDGERENLDGQQGQANRFNGLIQYNF